MRAFLGIYAFSAEDGAFSPVLENWNEPIDGGSCLGAALYPRSGGGLNYQDNEVGRVLQASASSMRIVSIKGLNASGKKPDICHKAWYGSTTEGAGPNEDVSVEAFMSARVIPTPRRVAIDTSTSVASKECDTDTMTCRQSDSRASEEGTRLSTSTRSSTKLASAHMELDAEARIRQVVEEEERANRDRTSSSILRVGNNSTEALRFKYMRCDEAKPKECTIDLRVNSNPLLGDSALVAAGKWYWAIPWEGAGGNIFIAPHDMPQKCLLLHYLFSERTM